MPYPVTADGLSPEKVSRRCLHKLGDYWAELAEECRRESDPTESDLEEMQAEEEGWGHQWRAQKEDERFQQAEHDAREREKTRKRKREEDRLAKILADTAEREKEERDRKAMFENHEWEIRNMRNWRAACEALLNL